MNGVLFFISMTGIRLIDSVVSHINKAKWGWICLSLGIWSLSWNTWVRRGSLAGTIWMLIHPHDWLSILAIGCHWWRHLHAASLFCLDFLTTCRFYEWHLKTEKQTRTIFSLSIKCQRSPSITSGLLTVKSTVTNASQLQGCGLLLLGSAKVLEEHIELEILWPFLENPPYMWHIRMDKWINEFFWF